MTDFTGPSATDPAARLAELLSKAKLPSLSSAQLSRFAVYLDLLLRWNARLNLTAVRDPDEILSRHFVECIAAAQALPDGISTLLDFGSGAGFPGIPIALCRPEIAVTLAESQGKKAGFLQECVRTLGLNASVHSGRAENLERRFSCVTLRAVDRMGAAISATVPLVVQGGWLAPMTTLSELSAVREFAGPSFAWSDPVALPNSEQRVLALANRIA
jgi:16S rRNA (guanine527-N7)-methyltransferase